MDEFKFRVWDSKNKVYYGGPQPLLDGITGNLFMQPVPDFLGIEFCTGIRDKNDTLIYMGDIINWSGKGWGIEIGKAEMAELWLEEAAGEPEDYEIVGNIHTDNELLEE